MIRLLSHLVFLNFIIGTLSHPANSIAPHKLFARDGYDFSDWKPPGVNDLRSPCPALNSLANHGFVPRDGRNLNIADTVRIVKDVYNVGPEFAYVATIAALLSSSVFGFNFNLDNIDYHNLIEHDSSLTRGDAYFGDNHTFNSTIWNVTVNQIPPGNDTYFDAKTLGTARYERVKHSKANNPEFFYPPKIQMISYGESCFLLSVFGDYSTGIAPSDWVRTFVEQERIPYLEGWRTPEHEIDLSVLVTLAKKMQEAAPDTENLETGLDISIPYFFSTVIGSLGNGFVPCFIGNNPSRVGT